MRFTVADVEKFQDLVKNSQPTYYECIPTCDPLHSEHRETCYTLYLAHEFDNFLDALEKRGEHIARYVLNAAGELCFGHEGEPGKFIPEHWQMLGEDTMIIAAGNIFIKHRKITSLNDQSACATGLFSLVYTLCILHNHQLPLALNLELIESKPKHNNRYSSFLTRGDLQKIIGDSTDCSHQADHESLDEKGIFIEGMEENDMLYVHPSIADSFSRLGLFHNKTDQNITTTQEQSSNYGYPDALETKTIKEEAATW